MFKASSDWSFGWETRSAWGNCNKFCTALAAVDCDLSKSDVPPPSLKMMVLFSNI